MQNQARDKHRESTQNKSGVFLQAGKLTTPLMRQLLGVELQVRQRNFLRHLYIKCIVLPRQARDKHRANSKKCRFLEAGEVLSPRSLGCFRCFRLEPVLAKQSSLMMSTTCMFETQSFLFRPCTRGWRRHQSRALPSRSEVTKTVF